MDRQANHRYQLCYRSQVPQSIGCHHCGKSSRPIADYPNQRIVRDRPCAAWGGVRPRCVDDPYPLVSVRHSRCADICIRLVWVPEPKCLPMFGAVKGAVCLCFSTPFSAHFMLHIVYCWRWYTKCRLFAAGGLHPTPQGTGKRCLYELSVPAELSSRIKVYLCIRWLLVFCP